MNDTKTPTAADATLDNWVQVAEALLAEYSPVVFDNEVHVDLHHDGSQIQIDGYGQRLYAVIVSRPDSFGNSHDDDFADGDPATVLAEVYERVYADRGF
jgi:hypothetical protein